MIRLIAAAGFVLAVATSAQAITPAPIPQSDGMITQVRLGCGPGRTRVGGVCVARTTIRHTRRMVRRGYRRGYYWAQKRRHRTCVRSIINRTPVWPMRSARRWRWMLYLFVPV